MKLFSFLEITILLLAIIPLSTFAQEETDIEVSEDVPTEEEIEALDKEVEKDINEVRIMTHGIGVTIRLLQLQLSIVKRIAFAQEVIEEIKNIDQQIDTSELESIVADLTELEKKIESLKEETDVDNSIEQYIEIKKEAIRLVFLFRKKLLEILTPEQREEIREKIINKRFPRVEEIRKRLLSIVRNYNGERLKEIANEIDLKVEDLVERVKQGEITAKEARKIILIRLKLIAKPKKRILSRKINERRNKMLRLHERVLAKRLKLKQEKIKQIRKIINNFTLPPLQKRITLKKLREKLVEEKKEELRKKVIPHRVKKRVIKRIEKAIKREKPRNKTENSTIELSIISPKLKAKLGKIEVGRGGKI